MQVKLNYVGRKTDGERAFKEETGIEWMPGDSHLVDAKIAARMVKHPDVWALSEDQPAALDAAIKAVGSQAAVAGAGVGKPYVSNPSGILSDDDVDFDNEKKPGLGAKTTVPPLGPEVAGGVTQAMLDAQATAVATPGTPGVLDPGHTHSMNDPSATHGQTSAVAAVGFGVVTGGGPIGALAAANAQGQAIDKMIDQTSQGQTIDPANLAKADDPKPESAAATDAEATKVLADGTGVVNLSLLDDTQVKQLARDMGLEIPGLNVLKGDVLRAKVANAQNLKLSLAAADEKKAA